MALAPDIVAGVARRLAEHAGLELPAWVVEARTSTRLALLGIDAASYLELIATGRGAAELDALVEAVRVGESSLFRHRPQIAALVEVVAPALRARGKRALKVWSAGCATGEEPYTLAAVLARALPGIQLTVIGTDVSADALDRARRGVYPAGELADVPDEWRDTFTVTGDRLHVHPDIAQLVSFERANLVETAPPRGCDLVFCRNVLIYFSAEARRRVIDRLIAALAPGGYLFVGYSETLRDITQLEAQRHGDTVFYVRKETTSPGTEAYRTPPYGTQLPPRPSSPAIPIATDEERETTAIGVAPPPRPPTLRSIPPSASKSSPNIAVPGRSPSAPGIAAKPSSPNIAAKPSSPNLAVRQPAANSTTRPSSANVAAKPSSPNLAASRSSPNLAPPRQPPSLPRWAAEPVGGTVRITLTGQPNPQELSVLLAERLAHPDIERLVIDLDTAELLADELVPVLRRVRAAGTAEDVTVEIVATKPNTRRWLSRHNLADVP